jgi:hypothetical protein
VICISEKQNIFSDGAGQGGETKAWGATDLPVGQIRADRERLGELPRSPWRSKRHTGEAMQRKKSVRAAFIKEQAWHPRAKKCEAAFHFG